MKEIFTKPEQIYKISKIGSAPKQNQVSSGDSSAFSTILSEQLNQDNNDSISSDKISGLPELEGMFRSKFIEEPFDHEAFTRKFSSSIDLLDKYSSWLSDPKKTLKQAYGLLEKLAEQATDMNLALDKFTESDPGKKQTDTNQNLKTMVNHLTATIRVEQIKINRGDYSDLS